MLKAGHPPTLIRSVRRASAMLELIASHPRGRTATETARALAIPLPTAHHILNTLVHDGLLSKDAQRRYRLGPVVGLMAEGLFAQTSAPEHLIDVLRELADRTGDTAYLSAWRNNDAVLLSIIDGRRAVRVAGLYVGFTGAAHARASGKVLLAFAPPGTIDEYLAGHDIAARAGDTSDAHDERRFRAELHGARIAGYAVDEEGFAKGVACIAAPVADGSLAVGISLPLERFREERQSLIDTVVEVAAEGASGRVARVGRK